MRIAIVSDAIYPYNKGGKEKRIYEISTGLAKLGHHVTLYCMKWWDGPNVRMENGVHLKAISPLYPLYSGQRRSIRQGVLFGISCLKLLTESFDVIDVDHMPFFPLYFTKLACILKRKKMIANWHEVWGKDYWFTYMGAGGIFGYLMEKFSIYMPDEIIASSTTTLERLRNTLHFNKTIYYIPNGINLQELQKVTYSPEKSDIIFAGRLLKHKNVDVLIKTIALLKKKENGIKCIIVGEGPEKNNLIKLVKRLNLEKNIIFKEFFHNHGDLYSLIKSAGVFVLPSTREGFGLAVLEANALGCPVITIDHPDNASRKLIIERQNGMISALDEHMLAKSIMDVFKDLPHYKKNAYKSTEQFDWDSSVKKVLKAYKL